MTRKNKNSIVLLALLCMALIANGQDKYQWQSKLSGVSGEGFYKVLLGPNITALSESAYSDLRIVDSAGHYVPYLIKSAAPSATQEFQLLNFSTRADTVFTVQVENPAGRLCEELWFTLRNTAIRNQAFLTGSDDGQKWFDISDVVIHSGEAKSADTFEQRISFPPVRYKHLRLSMRKSQSIPIYVVHVGIYESQAIEGHYTLVPAPELNQKDSNKVSYVSVKYDGCYTLDKLLLHAEGAKLYHRLMRIYSRDSNNVTLLEQTVLSSDSKNVVNISAKTRELLIEIDNQDNPPLRLTSVAAFQLNRYANFYLDDDRSYFLVFGNQKAKSPVYDIGYFEDSMRAHRLKELAAGPIVANTIVPGTQPVTHAEIKKGLKAYWIWPVLIAVLGILLFFTFIMGREISGKE